MLSQRKPKIQTVKQTRLEGTTKATRRTLTTIRLKDNDIAA